MMYTAAKEVNNMSHEVVWTTKVLEFFIKEANLSPDE